MPQGFGRVSVGNAREKDKQGAVMGAEGGDLAKSGLLSLLMEVDALTKQIRGVSVVLHADFPLDSMGFANSAYGQKRFVGHMLTAAKA